MLKSLTLMYVCLCKRHCKFVFIVCRWLEHVKKKVQDAPVLTKGPIPDFQWSSTPLHLTDWTGASLLSLNCHNSFSPCLKGLFPPPLLPVVWALPWTETGRLLRDRVGQQSSIAQPSLKGSCPKILRFEHQLTALLARDFQSQFGHHLMSSQEPLRCLHGPSDCYIQFTKVTFSSPVLLNLWERPSVPRGTVHAQGHGAPWQWMPCPLQACSLPTVSPRGL